MQKPRRMGNAGTEGREIEERHTRPLPAAEHGAYSMYNEEVYPWIPITTMSRKSISRI